MKTINWAISKKDARTIAKIARRAVAIDAGLNRESTEMDITACHLNGCPLDLAKLEGFDGFNLMHDVYGIARHLDRETGELRGHFLPRCSR